jgi:hypothetical protein
MSGRVYGGALLLLAALLGSSARPAAAQLISAAPQSMPFPVLAGADFTVDPAVEQSLPLYNIAHGALQLRANDAGWVDMEPYCQLPDRHWGPVSMVSCTLEVSGGSSLTGLALPARVALNSLPMGTTVTLRLLMQAPIIIVDLEGQPSAILDTFIEEYHWTLTNSSLKVAGQ